MIASICILQCKTRRTPDASDTHPNLSISEALFAYLFHAELGELSTTPFQTPELDNQRVTSRSPLERSIRLQTTELFIPTVSAAGGDWTGLIGNWRIPVTDGRIGPVASRSGTANSRHHHAKSLNCEKRPTGVVNAVKTESSLCVKCFSSGVGAVRGRTVDSELNLSGFSLKSMTMI